jgi:bifunctional non-homologous end joining protein LigD
VHSCLIDGEAIVCDENGLAVFQLIRNYRRGSAATLCAFDLIELNGEDLRQQPIEDRKLALKRLLGKAHPALLTTAILMLGARSFSRMPASSVARASYRSASARHIGSADRRIGSKSRTRPRQR